MDIDKLEKAASEYRQITINENVDSGSINFEEDNKKKKANNENK